MPAFTSILVDVDATATAHPALDRALGLARSCGARLTIVDVFTIGADDRRSLQRGLEDLLVTQRRQQLTRIAQGITGLPVDCHLLSGRPATALIREVLRSGHDLLVRSHARDLVAPSFSPYGAVDMELFRQCPCPVLIVGPGARPPHPRIVGAVHASTDDPAEQALNRAIVELTIEMANREDGTPMLLQAWTPFAERLVRSQYTDEAFAAYADEARRRAGEDLAGLADAFRGRLSPEHVALRRGQPQDVIPEFAVAEGVDLVVMGTVARSGIAGLLIGNTAERVLRKLRCSVLAIKPDGFVAAVPSEGSV